MKAVVSSLLCVFSYSCGLYMILRVWLQGLELTPELVMCLVLVTWAGPDVRVVVR